MTAFPERRTAILTGAASGARKRLEQRTRRLHGGRW